MPKVAFEVCHRHQQRHAGHRRSSIVALALLGAEGRGSDLGRGPGDRPADRSTTSGDAACPRPATSRVGDVDPLRDALGGLVREGVVTVYPGGAEPVYAIDPEQAPRGRLLPQREHPLLRQPGDRRARAAPRRRDGRARSGGGGLAGGAAPARPAQVRVLLRPQARVRGGDARRGDADGARLGEPHDPAEDIEAVLEARRCCCAPRVLRPFVEAYRVVAERLAARDPRAPVDEEEFLARVHRRRPAEARLRAAHGRRVGLARAVRRRAAARRQPRPDDRPRGLAAARSPTRSPTSTGGSP